MGGKFPPLFLARNPSVANLAFHSGIATDLLCVGDCLALGAEVSGEGDAGSLANVLFVVSSVFHFVVPLSFFVP